MSHIDEGLLHAYLDGAIEAVGPGLGAQLDAHLAGCADCRARLEEARRVRAAASGLLAGAAPAGVSAPPFDTVLARAGQSGARRMRLRVPSVTSLAWAASIVVALGTGWWAHEYALRNAQPDFSVSPMQAKAEAEAKVADRESGAENGATVRRYDGATVPRYDGAKPPQVSAERGELAKVEQATRRAEDVQLEAPVVAAAEPPAAAAGVEAGIAPAGPLAPSPSPSPPPQPAPAPAAPPVAAADDADAAWRTVERAEAERWLGASIVEVEGLPTLEFAIARQEGARVVRTIQSLSAGATLELLQSTASPAREQALRRYAAAPAAPPAAAKARTEAAVLAERPPLNALTVLHQGQSVTVRAPLPADSLRVLVARLRN